MKKLIPLLLAMVSLAGTARAQENPTGRADIPFDNGWRFHPGDAPGAEKPEFKDADWRRLDLPHDYAIEGAFDIHSPAGAGGGYLTAGTAWYRRSFPMKDFTKGMRLAVMFDGVYMDSDVYINGVHLGNHPYGYTGFYYDLTPYLHLDDKPNVLAVRVNVQQPSSRWYSGAGIYRHVHLIATQPVHIDPWGVAITTSDVSHQSATIRVRTRVTNDAGKEGEVTVTQTLFTRYKDKKVEPVTTTFVVAASGSHEFDQTFKFPYPELWSPQFPNNDYRIKTDVRVGSQLVDTVTTTFGIRSIQFTADQGFLINDVPCPIRGVCLHHDLGCLGSAAFDEGIKRELTLLKSIGVNAIRTSHNPPAPGLLKLCDEMGFLVMDEAFDEWKINKTKFGYGRFFDEWSERDLVSMVRRDINHPSVILWSIGNEIEEQKSPEGGAMAKRLADIVRREDPSRPVTSGCNMADHAIDTGYAAALDVLGINYHIDWYEKLKGRPLTGSETASAISTRGEYNLLPGADGKLQIKAEYSHQMSSYDVEAPPWATLVEPSLQSLAAAPWVAGQFVWTGFDYIGEPTPFDWPSRSSYFGIFDLAGFPKDRAYLYQAQWTTRPFVHLFPHWNWEGQEGKEIPVRCYTNVDSVELFLNDKSLGVRDFKENKTLHLEWLVPYAPGTLRAVGTKDGKVIAADEITTTGAPAKIVIVPDKTNIAPTGQSLSYVAVYIMDKEGRICPNAASDLKFTLTGPGILAGTDNGDPTDHTSFQSPMRKAFHGRALTVIRSTHEKGVIQLTVESEGLAPASTKITNAWEVVHIETGTKP